jgi:hypothetical protein
LLLYSSHLPLGVPNGPVIYSASETRPERGDRATLASARPWGSVGLWSGWGGALIGEAGRPGMLPTPLARPGARRLALAIAGMEGEVGLRGLY